MKRGGIIVDMTTSKLSLAKMVSIKALERGIYTLNAPVSGDEIGAKNVTLSIMVGIELETFDKV